ncbi:hypothetical protein BTO06_05345 [Tenacibaculum sp. SZ-18]|uniref:glycosyltransferase family 39 protein n=1 Tax=Tenacibaculum sp. SZ-18 TaxID=754423 RepID=UPI000C2D06C8|nr:glycosyltransferase family 39 protein [Tenacibaculum sp. SZ-18]AUC14596.1 hypothetical protein BTO06_05345 [Tenacibaculum sp. SZ-18]
MNISYKQKVLVLILISVLLRLFLAGVLEFGNDEVYYWLYAKYPDVSHFDHPPMVGFFIQFFTGNLYFDSELAIRLAAIIPSGLSMYVVFLIGSYLKDSRTGFIACLLYCISIYGFIISGILILPDSPLVLFWLLSYYFFIQTIPNTPEKKYHVKLLLGFLFSGLAIYSKYQGVYVLFGVCIYVLFSNRKWLKNAFFYLGFIFPLTAIALVFYWNYTNDFVSYKFHGNRVSFFSSQFNKNSFIREILGQFIYNNPYIVITLVLLLIAIWKKKFHFSKNYIAFFFYCSFPLILTTIYLSISRNTLPHWSGVSYLTFLPLIATFLSERKKNITKRLSIGIVVFSVLMITTTFVINNGLFLPEENSVQKEKLGRKDALLDMYGWEQASEKITQVFKEEYVSDLPIISNRWYPAAHIDYYIARPNDMKVYGIGNLNEIHKYYWINQTYSELGDEVLYITDSRNFKNPETLFEHSYSKINLLRTLPIERSGVVVKYVFLYKLSKV